ncbi:MAG: serine/threonine-protein kinase [Planctomycetes bacterium]|nr:serine/threonine-protein kinase [Planctomycetota bacterium]
MPGDTESGADDALLDELLGRFVGDVTAGRTPDLDAALPGRPDLRGRVAETWELAQRIAPRRPVRRPEIGGYEIEEEIGRGGMGHVWRARHARLGRVVALKLLPGRLASSRTRERFERESRAVARLEHPGIVRVYESGDSDDQAWFAMELVAGRTLAQVIDGLRAGARPVRDLAATDLALACTGAAPPRTWPASYADAAALLVADVADALHFAHTHGVVHRDVKPSNVIVRTSDARPLLFDFGLADDASEATLTISGDFLGTPHYASPEQAAGAAKDLDARTDVWSLGATLFELLTLARPFSGPSTHEILTAVRTREPSAARSLNGGIRADLATVVHRALEKDVSRRYRTAADFAADLRAAVEGREIAARRVGAAGRAVRWARRNRAAAAAILLGLLLVVGTPTALLVQQMAATARVTSERNRADGVTQFLLEAFRSADPDADGREARVVDVLQRAAKTAETRFAGDAATRAAVLDAISDTLYNMGLVEESVAPCRAAAAAHAATGDVRGELRARSAEGMALSNVGRLAEATALLRTCVERAAAALPPSDSVRLEASVDLASVLVSGDGYDEATRLLGGVRDAATAARGADDPLALRAGHEMGLALSFLGRNGDAIPLLRDVLARREAVEGASSINAVATAALLGQLLSEESKTDEAVAMLSRVAAATEAQCGASGMRTVVAVHNLCGALQRAGRLDEARAKQADLVEVTLARGPVGWDMRTLTVRQLGEIEAALGHDDEAIRRGLQALDEALPVEGRDQFVEGAVLLAVPRMLSASRTAEALAMWTRAVEASPGMVEDEPELAPIRDRLAAALEAAGDSRSAAAVRGTKRE